MSTRILIRDPDRNSAGVPEKLIFFWGRNLLWHIYLRVNPQKNHIFGIFFVYIRRRFADNNIWGLDLFKTERKEK